MLKVEFTKETQNRYFLISVIFLWLCGIGWGLYKIYSYEVEAGATDFVAKSLPEIELLQHDENVFQLVMVAHPHCPCTRASIGELEIIMARTKGRLKSVVLFHKPDSENENWIKTDLFRKTKTIPGVKVILDKESHLAKLFGGTTSGQTFLYNPQGELIFHGGITASRGHAGSNFGRNAIVNLVYHKQAVVTQTPFFGCTLRNSGPNIEVNGETLNDDQKDT